jgi:hypothetical protein|tara:strand:- start:283 stop:1401 length:1119 start_codon:yes stop_codon:yes gene_type:complete
MVLPLLFSVGLPALAGTGALGATLGAMSVPALAGIGAGLGSFVQTGDIGKGIQTGMTSFLGGKILGGLSGSTSGAAAAAAQGAPAAAAPQGGFLQAAFQPSPSATSVVSGGASDLATKFLGTETANAAMPFGTGTKGGAFTAGQQAFMPAMLGQSMADMQMIENRAAKDDDDDEDKETRPPMPNPMVRTFNPNPYAGSPGEGLYFQYQRRPRADGSTPKYPYYYAEGGEVEVDEMMEDNGMNEKDVIVEAIKAIKGMSDQPEIVLAMFVQKYGEDALRDLVGRVQSGELDDTVARFAEGDKGMVRGPGDGSGVDDMVPATLEGEQDVLLSDGEFVLRKNTTDALEKAYGGGFLDIINRAEEDAPEKLEQMVG